MKVVLSPNPYRDRGLKAALKAREILKSGGVDTSLCLPFDLEQGSGHAELPRDLDYRNMQDELERADILLCFGGDGTILHAARDANAHNVPILSALWQNWSTANWICSPSSPSANIQSSRE